jgi:hypothetical protein
MLAMPASRMALVSPLGKSPRARRHFDVRQFQSDLASARLEGAQIPVEPSPVLIFLSILRLPIRRVRVPRRMSSSTMLLHRRDRLGQQGAVELTWRGSGRPRTAEMSRGAGGRPVWQRILGLGRVAHPLAGSADRRHARRAADLRGRQEDECQQGARVSIERRNLPVLRTRVRPDPRAAGAAGPGGHVPDR